MSIDAMKQAREALELLARYENPQTKIQVRKPKDGGPIVTMYPHKVAMDAADALRLAIEQAEKQAPTKLWLWKNFVGGRPEYWAFDNPFPCVSVGGDPLTLGEPCGWALLKSSVNGRPDRSEQEVINTVTRLAPPSARGDRYDTGSTD